MDLGQILLTILAFVATVSGFIPTRKTRPRFYQRQPQGRNPSISVVTNLSGHGRQQPPTASNGAQPTRGINHKFTIHGAPRNPNGAINIISNIILHTPPKGQQGGQQGHQARPGNPNSHQGPTQGHGQSQGQGQPQGHGQGQPQGHGQGRSGPGGRRGVGGRQRMSGRRGAAPYNVLRRMGGARNRYPLNNGQQAHGRSIFDVLARGGNMRGSGLPRGVLSLVGSGHGRFVSALGHGHGHGHGSVTIVNNTGLLSLLQAAQRSGNMTSSAGAKGGNPSQIVLIPHPQLSSSGALVLSADNGAGYPHANPVVGSQSKQAPSLFVAGGPPQHVMTTKAPTKGAGFVSGTTLKPGEDPPEVEF